MRVMRTVGGVALVLWVAIALPGDVEAKGKGRRAKARRKAVAAHVAAARLTPGTAEQHTDRGRVLFAEGRYTLALAEHEEALRLGGETPERRLRVARCYEALGHADIATEMYRVVVLRAEDPYDADEARLRIARLEEQRSGATARR